MDCLTTKQTDNYTDKNQDKKMNSRSCFETVVDLLIGSFNDMK